MSDPRGPESLGALVAGVRRLRIRETIERCGGSRLVRSPALLSRLVASDERLLLDAADPSLPLNSEAVLGALLAEYPYLMMPSGPGALPTPAPAAPITPTPTPRPGRAN